MDEIVLPSINLFHAFVVQKLSVHVVRRLSLVPFTFQLSPDLMVDYDSYTWRKLEYNSEEAKKLITEYWMWEGDFDGKKFNLGKTFK